MSVRTNIEVPTEDSLDELNDYLWSEESPYGLANLRWQISQSHSTYYAMMTIEFAVVSAGSGRTERSAKMEAARKYMNEVKGGNR